MAFVLRLISKTCRAATIARCAAACSPYTAEYNSSGTWVGGSAISVSCSTVVDWWQWRGAAPFSTSGLLGFVDWRKRNRKGFVPSSMHGPVGSDGLPISIDWRSLGAVTPVVDQGDCGSCWAHAATSSIESLTKLVTNDLPKLSEQQLLYCVDVNCAGCLGGSMVACFKYVKMNGGLVHYSLYPYEGHFNKQHRSVEGIGVTIDSYGYMFNATDDELKVLVACQPVVAVLGADPVFRAYKEGVVDGRSYTMQQIIEKNIGHAVTVVGYGHNPKSCKDFWLVKNSWSERFGKLDGYIYIWRNSRMRFGAFGINNFISYPIMSFSCSNVHVTVKSESELGMGLPWYRQIKI